MISYFVNIRRIDDMVVTTATDKVIGAQIYRIRLHIWTSQSNIASISNQVFNIGDGFYCTTLEACDNPPTSPSLHHPSVAVSGEQRGGF